MLKIPYKIVLGSQSPRRKELLAGIDVDFTVNVIEIDETNFPVSLDLEEVPEYIAIEKGKAHLPFLSNDELVLTADTIVLFNKQIFGKPKSREEAVEMLKKLSGNKHEVISGVCLTSKNKTKSFSDKTIVQFKSLSEEQIDYYLDTYKPYDKAGSYGIQEWI
jgi:septum formation protein